MNPTLKGLIRPGALRRDLKAGRLAGGYLFYGEEDYLKRHSLGLLTQAVEKRFGPVSTVRLDAEDFSLNAFDDACENMTFGALAQVVQLRDVEPAALPGGQGQALLERLANLPEGVVVVLTYGDGHLTDGTIDTRRRRERQIKELTATLCAVEFPLQSADALREWMGRRLGAEGLHLAGDAVSLLLARCDNRMTALSTELQKLTALCQSEGQTVVTVDMVEAVALPGGGADLYGIVGCMTSGDYEGALRRLNRCRRNRESPVAATTVLGMAFTELLCVKMASDAGMRSTDAILKRYGIKASKRYFIGGYLRQAQDMDRVFPAHAVAVLAQCDLAQKSSGRNQWELLEQALADIHIGRGFHAQ